MEDWIVDLRVEMLKHGIKVKDIAEKLGFTRPYISEILCGRRKPIGAQERLEKAVSELVKERG